MLDIQLADRELSLRDPVMKRLVRQFGPCGLRPKPRRSPFESLARAIANQQLNGKAAESILNRFIALFPGKKFPGPGDLAAVSDEAIRAAGFSRAKIAALRDLSEKTLNGTVPSAREFSRLSDEEVIERLVEVRGIGRWTVEMLLIFQLGRPDVLPADDFGVRTGYAKAYGLEELPRPKKLLELGEPWRPHRTVASWYLWRAAEKL